MDREGHELVGVDGHLEHKFFSGRKWGSIDLAVVCQHWDVHKPARVALTGCKSSVLDYWEKEEAECKNVARMVLSRSRALALEK